MNNTPVVENHPTTKENRELLWPRSIPTEITVYLHEKLAYLHTGNTQMKDSNIASEEDIMENNYMFAILWNLSVISHLIFPQCSS